MSQNFFRRWRTLRIFLDCKGRYPCDVRELMRSYGISLTYAPVTCDYIAIADRSIGKKTVWQLPISSIGKTETGELKWIFDPNPNEEGNCEGIVYDASKHEIGTYERMKLLLTNDEEGIVVTLNEL